MNPLKRMMGAFVLTMLGFCLMPAIGQAQTYKAPKGKQCAKENGKCNFRGTGFVYYGAGKKWRGKRVTNGIRCNNKQFGDPAPGVVKSCFVNHRPLFRAATGRACANEGGVCRFRGRGIVYYGAGKRWFRLKRTGAVRCSSTVFGDPHHGVPKRCVVSTSLTKMFAKPMGKQCAKENGKCNFRGSAAVFYGSGKRWIRRVATSGVACNSATFGDPKPGVVKTCFFNQRELVNVASGNVCAKQGGVCTFNGKRVVYYGAGKRWFKTVATSRIRCGNGVFGDPNYGVPKVCRVSAKVVNPLTASARPVGFKCGKQGGACRFNGKGIVYYGAGKKWVAKKVTNGIPCNNKQFGDPAPGVSKLCYVNKRPIMRAAPSAVCAKEGGICKFQGTRNVYYGAGNRWFRLKRTGAVRCSNGVFGNPNFGVSKTCRVGK